MGFVKTRRRKNMKKIVLAAAAFLSAAAMANTALELRQKIENDCYDWHKRHELILKEGKLLKPEVVFIGDSITHFWTVDRMAIGGKNSAERWLKHFGKYNALNLGFGWDRTCNVLWRIANGELEGVDPKAFVIHIGGNNFSKTKNYPGNTPAEVEEGIFKIVETLHGKFPKAKMIVMGVFPFGTWPNQWHRPKIRELNALLAKNSAKYPYVTYMDITDKLTDEKGKLIPECYGKDPVHPNTQGYEVWAAAIKPRLAEICGH